MSDLDLIPIPVLKLDREGNVRFLNRAAESLLAELQVSRADAFRILPADILERVRAAHDEGAPSGVAHAALGRAFFVTVSPDPTECIVALEDRCSVRDAEAQLLRAEKMASLGNLVAGVAHEINTPVGSIHANADIMLRALEKLKRVVASGGDDAERARLVELLEGIGKVNQSACERIVRLVRSLKNFARGDEAERKLVNLHEEIESTLALVEHELKNRIEVVRDYGEIPGIECYPHRLSQVFLNLLVNAAHAIPGRGTIVIKTRRDEKEVKIAIADSGRGVRPEHLARIFEPGFTTKGAGVGSGLGLPISRKIVESHGGRIEVESEVGRGTTFTVVLPLSH